MQMQERINTYWSKRAEEFSHFRLMDLAGPQRTVWTAFIRAQLPSKEGIVRALDTGTGAGFFAFLLAELGCETTGIDYSQDMIDQAESNAAMLRYPSIRFVRMDAQHMELEDGSFDFIISRNVTWTVPEPEKVYAEWFRVLAPGGVVINIDANYGYVFKRADESGWTEKQNAKWKAGPEKLIGTRPDMVNERNNIAKQLSIAGQNRPQWDLDGMLRLGFTEVSARVDFMTALFPAMKGFRPRGEQPFETEPGAPDTRIFMVKGVK